MCGVGLLHNNSWASYKMRIVSGAGDCHISCRISGIVLDVQETADMDVVICTPYSFLSKRGEMRLFLGIVFRALAWTLNRTSISDWPISDCRTDKVSISGQCKVSISGQCKVSISGQCKVSISGQCKVSISGQCKVSISGQCKVSISGQCKVSISGQCKVSISGQCKVSISGQCKVSISGQCKVSISGQCKVSISGQCTEVHAFCD